MMGEEWGYALCVTFGVTMLLEFCFGWFKRLCFYLGVWMGY
jgi:hypothetical protein